ncbi:MAG: hypothetical protein KDK24_21455 [Pseudooceanicola sp.]|nr:hypothetical protein [Pseudooceanicola sp.]
MAGMTGRIAKGVALAALCAVALGACGTAKSKRTLFDGFYFKSKVKRLDDDYSRFIVSIQNASQSVDAAIQAGEYFGTRYCLETGLGTSRIKWRVGPETPVEQLVIVDDTLTFEGECNP